MPPAFVPLASTSVKEGYLRLNAAKLPGKRKAEKAIGHDLEATVIYTGMPVTSKSGARVGTVSDMVTTADGSPVSMEVTTGALGGLAFGKLEVDGKYLGGFNGGSVTMLVEQDDVPSSGGMARAAASSASTAQAKADKAAAVTGAAVVGASAVAGKAIRSAAQSSVVKRARTRWKDLADAFRDGYSGDEPPRK